jgi:hypothetical protein
MGWRTVAGRPFAPTGGPGTVSVAAVVAGPPWLAVGSQRTRSGQELPRAWSSPDGRAWRSDPVLPTTLDGPSDRLVAVARRGELAVAAGEYASAKEGNFRPTAWWRDPAGTWHDVDAPRELFGGERAGGVVGVAASAAGFIVVGGWTDADNQPDVGVWRSVDARAWSRVDGEGALSPSRGEVVVATGATGAPGGFVVVGESLAASATHGAAWWSPDGLHWSRSAVGGAAVILGVSAIGAGVVAVGLDETGAAASWRSADGRYWSPAGRLSSGAGAGAGAGAVSLVASAGSARGEALAAGIFAGHPRLWSYAHHQWQPLTLPSGLAGASDLTKLVVAAAGATTVVGADRTSGTSLWDSVSPRPVAAPTN